MGAVALQLDKLKNAKSLGTDSELADYLEVTRQTVSQWRKGDAYPDEERIAHFAKLAGEDAGVWLLQVREERSTGAAHAAWRSLLDRLKAAAIVGVVAVALLPQQGHATSGSVPSIDGNERHADVGIMRS